MPTPATDAPLSKFGKWCAHLGLSSAEISRRLDLSQTLVRRMKRQGEEVPTLRNAAKIVAGTDGEVSFEDLLPQKVRRAARRYRGRLLR